MKLDFAILADAVGAVEGGKLNVEGAGVDTISAPGTPFEHESLTLLSRVVVDMDEVGKPHRLDATLFDPQGNEVAHIFQDTDPVEPHPNPDRRPAVGFLMVMRGLSFPSFGAYQFRLTWDGNELHRIPLFAEPQR